MTEDQPKDEFCKMLNKTHIANLIAAFSVIAGIAFVFISYGSDTTVDPPQILTLIVGAGIGYLFAKKSA